MNNPQFTGAESHDFECYDNNILRTQPLCEQQGYVWDKRCTFDYECPFFATNLNYPNTLRGGCENGYCEFPVGVGRLSFKRYVANNEKSPLSCTTSHKTHLLTLPNSLMANEWKLIIDLVARLLAASGSALRYHVVTSDNVRISIEYSPNPFLCKTNMTSSELRGVPWFTT